MSTPGNSINISQSGLVVFDGTATFTGTTTTQYYTLTGGASNTINNVAPGTSGYVLTSAGASSQPSYAALPFTQMPWSDKSGNFNAVAGNGYFVTATCAATMPSGAAQGNIISFAVDNGTAILTITANTGQIIRIGTAVSASAGTAASNKNGDSITLVFRSSDSAWISVGGPQGTWTVI